jgi:hypothetical protein
MPWLQAFIVNGGKGHAILQESRFLRYDRSDLASGLNLNIK